MNDAPYARILRAYRYLRVAGAFSLWPSLALLAVGAYGWFVVRSGGEARDALYLATILLPFVAGTGLLSLGRTGRLDLLFGTGISRLNVWTAAALRSVVLPVILAGALTPLLLQGAPASTPFLAVLSFFIPAAICFTAGIVQPRYAPAVIWLAVRVIFILSTAGRAIYLRVLQPAPDSPPTTAETSIALFAMPELLMFAHLRPAAVAAAVATAVVILSSSAVLVARADFGGHRSA